MACLTANTIISYSCSVIWLSGSKFLDDMAYTFSLMYNHIHLHNWTLSWHPNMIRPSPKWIHFCQTLTQPCKSIITRRIAPIQHQTPAPCLEISSKCKQKDNWSQLGIFFISALVGLCPHSRTGKPISVLEYGSSVLVGGPACSYQHLKLKSTKQSCANPSIAPDSILTYVVLPLPLYSWTVITKFQST